MDTPNLINRSGDLTKPYFDLKLRLSENKVIIVQKDFTILNFLSDIGGILTACISFAKIISILSTRYLYY
jgi:hypothetical protein